MEQEEELKVQEDPTPLHLDCLLLRRIPRQKIAQDVVTKKWRPTSECFYDSSQDHVKDKPEHAIHCSHYEKLKLNELGFEDAILLAEYPDDFIVGIPYRVIVEQFPPNELMGFLWFWIFDPCPYREAHAFLKGEKTRGVRKRLANIAAEYWVVAPPSET